MQINWGQVLLVANAVFVGLVWIGRNNWSHRYIIKFGRRLQSVVPGYRTNRILEQLLEEMKTTSGRPLRDAIEHLAQGVEGLQGTLAMIHVRQKMYDRLLENATITTNEKGELTWASEGFLQICERTLEEVIDNNWISAIHQDDRERVVDEWQHAVRDGRDFVMEYRYGPTRDRSIILVEAHAYAARVGLSSRPVGWVAVVRVIDRFRPKAREDENEQPPIEPNIKKVNLRLDRERRCYHPEYGIDQGV